MKILYITNGITGTGGLERVLSIKASYLAEHYNYELTILTLNESEIKPFYTFSEKIKLKSINISGNPLRYVSLYIKGIKKTVKEFQPDIISVCDDGLKGFFIPTWLKTNCPIIYERHASITLNTNKTFFGRLVFFLMQKQAAKFSRFVVLTESNKHEWKAANVIVISNPLSFYPTQSAELVNSKVIVVGTHSHNKGYDLLLESWQKIRMQFPQWHLHIYGKVNKENTYIKLAQELNLQDCVFFHDPVTNIQDKYLESSIMLLSSRSEGFGMVLIEAMACGVPCISFDCPSGPSDIIEHEVDGILVPNGNITLFIKAIIRLIENKTLRNQMGVRAKANVTRFSLEIVARQWSDIFIQLIKKKQ